MPTFRLRCPFQFRNFSFRTERPVSGVSWRLVLRSVRWTRVSSCSGVTSRQRCPAPPVNQWTWNKKLKLSFKNAQSFTNVLNFKIRYASYELHDIRFWSLNKKFYFQNYSKPCFKKQIKSEWHIVEPLPPRVLRIAWMTPLQKGCDVIKCHPYQFFIRWWNFSVQSFHTVDVVDVASS